MTGLRASNMNRFNQTKLALVLTMALSASAFANEENIASDIPVTPINKERIPVATPEAANLDPNDTSVSKAIDKAMFDAMANSLPENTVKQALDARSGKVDLYGRPIQEGAKPEVRTELQATPILPGTTAANRVGENDQGSPLASILPEISGRDPVIDKVRKKYKPHQVIKLKPGKSELIPVALGLQNRIATTFKEAEVRTSDSEVPISQEGGFVYITPLSETPIGLMIGEAGMPETMVSLTLMPLDVPPVMAEVNVDMPKSMKYKHSKFLAEKNEIKDEQQRISEIKKKPVSSNDPRINEKHVERATSILVEVAGGEIPAGFDLVDKIPEDERFPCDIRQMGMYHEVGQRLISGRELIDVVRIKNDINGFREVREEFCLGEDVIAVGVFDKATLAPGEDTELYILRDKLHMERKSKVRLRPRLTSTN